MQTPMSNGRIQPYYFGPDDNLLFGCYHFPRTQPPRDCAVVLCHPVWHEYIKFHRACRLLAVRLSEVGFPVLRFDFLGCGDSRGDSSQMRISHWLANVSSAIDEVRETSGVSRVCVVGLRLGATLAANLVSTRGDVDSLVLWDAVVKGTDHLEELRRSHSQMLQLAHVIPNGSENQGQGTEILGFLISDLMLQDLQATELANANWTKPPSHMLVVESNEATRQERSYEELAHIVEHFEYQFHSHPQLWIWKEDYGAGLVPRQLLQSVTTWIAGVYA